MYDCVEIMNNQGHLPVEATRMWCEAEMHVGAYFHSK